MYKIQGWVEQGNTRISTGGLTSSNFAQASFPSCTVSVYLHSTVILASLFSDDNTIPTPLANPFTSNADGTFGFYAASGRYDLVFSGGNLPTPYTISDLTNGAGGGSGDVIGPAGAVPGNFAFFSGNTGKIIADSSVSPVGIVRGPTSAIGGHVAVFDSSSSTRVRDGGTGILSLVTGPASATDGNLTVFDGTSGKLVKDGGSPSGGFLQLSQVKLVSGDLTITSATFVDLTGVTVTITTGAHRCLVIVSGACNPAASGNVAVTLLIDGVNQGGTRGLVESASANIWNVSFSFPTAVLTAGSHTFKIQWLSSAGGSSAMFASSTLPFVFTVIETGLTT